MPFSDLSIPEAKKLFDLNVWSYLTVTQAFLPLLLSSKGMIVNQTSVTSTAALPFQSAYNASKAAIAMFSDTQRLELAPLGIKVVDLKTALVKSNLIQNINSGQFGDGLRPELPRNSIYAGAKEVVEKRIRSDEYVGTGMSASVWAGQVVKDLLRKKPPPQIWRGEMAWLAWFGTVLPYGWLDGTIKRFSGLDLVERLVKG